MQEYYDDNSLREGGDLPIQLGNHGTKFWFEYFWFAFINLENTSEKY